MGCWSGPACRLGPGLPSGRAAVASLWREQSEILAFRPKAKNCGGRQGWWPTPIGRRRQALRCRSCRRPRAHRDRQLRHAESGVATKEADFDFVLGLPANLENSVRDCRSRSCGKKGKVSLLTWGYYSIDIAAVQSRGRTFLRIDAALRAANQHCSEPIMS